MATFIIAKPILHGSATKFAGFLVAWRPWLEPAWQYFAIFRKLSIQINLPPHTFKGTVQRDGSGRN
jgi:hypothetical protein